jgi:signal transduction histidine kinase
LERSWWTSLPWIDAPDAAPQPTYFDELDHINSRLFGPCGILALVTWLPFLEVDIRVFGPRSPVLALRLGLSAVGLALLALHRVRRRAVAYWAVFGFLCYLELAAAAIVGWSAGDPAYLGGLAICFFLLAFWPLERSHAYGLLAASLIVFWGTSIHTGTGLSSPQTRYGLYDLVIAVFVAILGISWFGRWRLNLYDHRRELQRVNEELSRANRLKTEFLGIACHDLKNPLNLIVGNAHLIEMTMKKGVVRQPEIAANVARIQSSSEKMLLLIRRFLTDAELEDGDLHLEMTVVDMSDVVRTVVAANRFLAEAKGQRLEDAIAPACWTLGDRLCLEEIVDNLVNNAIKYSPEAAAIRVTLESREAALLLRLQDEGPGFTAEDTARLFRRHQRLSATPTAGESADGLGLAIVKKLVDAHRGRIWLESAPGCGAVFCVELQATRPGS